MGSPQPADLSKALDGLLTGLDSLMARREEKSPPTDAASRWTPATPHESAPGNMPGGTLSWMTALAIGSLQPDTAAGVAQAAHQMLRDHLIGRTITWAKRGLPGIALSPRWTRLLAALPESARFQPDPRPGFMQLLGIDESLAGLRAWAGPVGQTIALASEDPAGRVFRLPVLPELGAIATVQSGGYAAGRWSATGPAAVFFWLDMVCPGRPECAGLALVGSGRPLLVLTPPEEESPHS